MSAETKRRHGGHYYLILGVVFVTLLAMVGGASRADELQQFVVRAAAIIAVASGALAAESSRPFATHAASSPPWRSSTFSSSFSWSRCRRLPGLTSRAATFTSGSRSKLVSLRWRPLTLSPDRTLNAFAALIPATAIGLITFALDFRGRMLIARLLAGIACASAILGLIQLGAGGTSLHLYQTTSENSAVGLFANRNHQAVLMACALPIVAALASIKTHQEDWSNRHSALAILAALLLLMGAAATGSRMGLLLGGFGLAAAIIIYLVTSRVTESTQSRARRLSGRGHRVRNCRHSARVAPRHPKRSYRAALADPVDATRTAAYGPMIPSSPRLPSLGRRLRHIRPGLSALRAQLPAFDHLSQPGA